MTRHPIKVLSDGTRVYHNGTRYKPKTTWARGQSRKPADPGAMRYRGDWYLPLLVLADEERVMPETWSDEEGYEHGMWCDCRVCVRPAVYEKKWSRFKS